MSDWQNVTCLTWPRFIYRQNYWHKEMQINGNNKMFIQDSNIQDGYLYGKWFSWRALNQYEQNTWHIIHLLILDLFFPNCTVRVGIKSVSMLLTEKIFCKLLLFFYIFLSYNPHVSGSWLACKDVLFNYWQNWNVK